MTDAQTSSEPRAWIPHAILAVDAALILLLGLHFYRGRPIVNNSIDIWFDRSDPTVETLNQERRLFGADTWMLATVWMRTERAGEATVVSRSLTEELERIDGVSRVISPTSIEVLQRDGQGLFYDELDAQEWPALRDTLLRHPFAREFLVYAKSPEVFSLLIKEHTGASTPDTVRQRLVSEVRRILDTHPAVAASAVAGTAVINADLNRLSWGDFLLLIPLTVVVASVVLLAMLRFRWRTTAAILTPVGLTTAAIDCRDAVQRPAVHDGHDCAARPVLHARNRVEPACHQLDRELAPPARRQRGRSDARRLAGARPADHGLERHDGAGLRPARGDPGDAGAGDGAVRRRRRVAVRPAHPVRAAEVPVLARRRRTSSPATRRCMRANDGRSASSAGSPAWLTRPAAHPRRLVVAMVAVCAVVAWLISTVSYDSTYLNMIQPKERLRVDYARFDAAGLPSAQLSIVIRRGSDAPMVEAALNAAIVNATAEIEALPEVTKVVGPAAIFAEVAPALAGEQPLAQFAADDASVTDAYIFALSGGNTEIGSYVHDGLGHIGWWCSFPISTTPGSSG